MTKIGYKDGMLAIVPDREPARLTLQAFANASKERERLYLKLFPWDKDWRRR